MKASAPSSKPHVIRPRVILEIMIMLISLHIADRTVAAQDTLTGAFEGIITNSQTGEPIAGATAQIINQETNLIIQKRTDSRGRFYQGLLNPGIYTIRVAAAGFQTKEVLQRLFITRTGEVVPVPVQLDPVATSASRTPLLTVEDTDIRARINARDARRDGAFTEEEVSTLPLGASTLVRSFDELSLLLPGVAPPPQTLGNIAGPGVGPGVGSAGQFAVNGIRSRGNNFTVDGSDNNDEDIGVRRQGFTALIPQPIESIKEFQVITLLAPAQFGRNIGAQVNAVSKSGGNETHGTLFGFFNSSHLNARNFFDTADGDAEFALRTASNQPVLLRSMVFNSISFEEIFPGFTVPVFNFDSVTSELKVRNRSGGEDSLTLGQGGFAFGGPLVPETAARPGKSMFYFISAEGQLLNATKEVSFAVPTVEQRGFFGSGASGVFRNTPFGSPPSFGPVGSENIRAFPASDNGNAIFSFFPFPNHPAGIYGANTFTQQLPARGQGKVASGKLDANFKLADRQQQFTARYNFTDDFRDIPATGGAIFSSLKARVRTQNLSTFLNGELSGPGSTRPVFNQLRASYGRTRLVFDERRDEEFLLPSELLPNEPFLLNRPLLRNTTLPLRPGVANNGPVIYEAQVAGPGFPRFFDSGFGLERTILDNTEYPLGPVGQVNIAGFSPVGVDVFNFPQRRVNNTYQLADTLTLSAAGHSFAFGVDTRRSELNSDLPRNSLPLITFSGEPRFDAVTELLTRFPTNYRFTGEFINAVDFAAAGAASGYLQTLAAPGASSNINLRYYQLNYFGQDEWRVRPNLSLSYGLRYEYNTPPRELNRRIERTFSDSALDLIPALRDLLGGRTQIFDPDRNNFAPRVGVAYSPNLFGAERTTVLRAGFGVYYDQVLGAVVSQSRNVFPSFLTVNTGGGRSVVIPPVLSLNSPSCFLIIPDDFGAGDAGGRCGNEFTDFLPFGSPIVLPGTLNMVNPQNSLEAIIQRFNQFFDYGEGTIGVRLDVLPSGYGFTLPARKLQMPEAYHYSFSFETQLSRNLVASASYVGSQGRHLLRPTTPNLGQNIVLVAVAVPVIFCDEEDDECGPPVFAGFPTQPGTIRVTPQGAVELEGGRPRPGVGAVNIYETSANSRYDALQLQLRGRVAFPASTQFQVNYTFAKATDDVSDVFDLAGASALPQNSLTRAGERGPANFDVRHRFAYSHISGLPQFNGRNPLVKFLFGRLQLAGAGVFQTGQPFTVNSTIDVNLDGNLTDRLNSTDGIIQTGDRRQPLRLATNDPTTLLAPIGNDGQIGRNTFRAGSVLELDLSVSKKFAFTQHQNLMFRMDIFNFINRSNFGIPVRVLEAPGFGQATDTVTPGRRIQFGLKYSF